MHAELAAALAALAPEIGAPEGVPESLDGGITNRNFRVRAGGRDLVVRLPGKDTELLGIDRAAEREATAAAAATGLGPEVVAFSPDPPCLVTAFIPGRAPAAEELRAEPLVGEIGRALRAVHDCAPLRARFDAFAVVDAYAATARARGATVPSEYGRLIEGAHTIRAALGGAEHAPVPCHNDLLTANFLHDGARVRVVDWEYAGMGDRYFDLGNFAVNNGLGEADEDRLLAAYWGEPATPRRRATLRLMRIMSDFREGMWGVVQSGISALDFDFAGYAGEHLGRVGHGMADARFRGWLEEARGDRP